MSESLQRLARAARGFARRGRRTRHVVIASAVIGVLAAPVALAADRNPVDGGARNPGANASSGYSNETQIIGEIAQNQGGFAAGTGGYVTRQSNKSDTGGGAIYGCRAKAGTESCVAANNLSNGDAFRFQANPAAATIGQLRFGLDINKPVAKPPFVTNATGLVKNLNAEMLDGAKKDDFVAKGSLLFAQVAKDGAIPNSRGLVANATAPFHDVGDHNQGATLAFTGDISKCAVTATPSEVPANVTQGGAGDPEHVPSVVAKISDDKTHVELTEVNAEDTPYGVHVQVVC
jgi:hypothetical protein